MLNLSFLYYIISLLFSATNGIVASFVNLTSYEIAFFRASFAFLLQFGLFLVLKKGRFTVLNKKKSFFFLVLAGICQGFNWIFLFEAFASIGVSLGVLLGYCGPIFVMLLSPFLFHERLTITKIIGFLVVFAGVVLVNGRIFLEGNSMWGLFCGIMGAISYAGMNIANKFATEIEGSENSVILFFCAMTTITISMYMKQGTILPHPAGGEWIPLLYLGLLSTGIGNHLYFSSQKHLKAQTIAICGYLEPVCAVILSTLILHESLSLLQIFGAICILGGALFCELYHTPEK